MRSSRRQSAPAKVTLFGTRARNWSPWPLDARQGSGGRRHADPRRLDVPSFELFEQPGPAAYQAAKSSVKRHGARRRRGRHQTVSAGNVSSAKTAPSSAWTGFGASGPGRNPLREVRHHYGRTSWRRSRPGCKNTTLLPLGEGGPQGRMRVGGRTRSHRPALTLSRDEQRLRRRALKPSPNGRGTECGAFDETRHPAFRHRRPRHAAGLAANWARRSRSSFSGWACEVIAVDRYAERPGPCRSRTAAHVIPMTDAAGVERALILKPSAPHIIVPEIEAIATDEFWLTDRGGGHGHASSPPPAPCS